MRKLVTCLLCIHIFFSRKVGIEKTFLTEGFNAIRPCSSTCALTGFFWLLSHVIYLKLTRVLQGCLLSQASIFE